jgi:hypothetical protein
MRQANVTISVILALLGIAFVTVFGGIGFAVARATHGRPEWDSGIHLAIGVLFLSLGLFRQFRLAAYGPKSLSVNRMQESLMNSVWILLGVTQLIENDAVTAPLLALAAILVLAAAFRRPRRYF